MRHHDIDWVELGCRGWEIDESGAELEGPDGVSGCHLDRATLHIMVCGYAPFCLAALRDLADVGVPGLRDVSRWRVIGVSGTAGRTVFAP